MTLPGLFFGSIISILWLVVLVFREAKSEGSELHD